MPRTEEDTISMLSCTSNQKPDLLKAEREGAVSITVEQAGRRGGLTVLKKRGRDFYVEIGHKGQLALRNKHPSMASEWGKLGGRPRKLKLDEVSGQGSKSSERRSADPP